MNDAEIPDDMVAWHGGYDAPPDWNGGPVLFRGAGLSVDGLMPEEMFWDHARCESHKAFDIIAYTPVRHSEAEV